MIIGNRNRIQPYFVKMLLCILLFAVSIGCTSRIFIRDANLNGNSEKVLNNNFEYTFYSNQNIKKELTYNWDASTFGSFSNTYFATFDEYLITTDLGGSVTCYKIENGKKIGVLKYKGEISQAAIVDKFNIFFIVNNYSEATSTLIVYDYKKGKEVASTNLPETFSTELIFVNDNIYAVSNFGTIYKFNLNAWIIWEKDFDIQVSSNPATDGNNLYFASSNGEIFSIDLTEGKLNFRKKVSIGFQSGISVNKNNIFIGDDYGTMFSLDKKNGNINWEYSSGTKIVHTPAIDNNSIFFGNLQGSIFSLDKFSGKLNWVNNTNGLVNTAPLVLDNALIQPNLNKHIDVLNKETGKVIQKLEFDGRCRTSPIYYKGSIFFGVDKGLVFSYKLD